MLSKEFGKEEKIIEKEKKSEKKKREKKTFISSNT